MKIPQGSTSLQTYPADHFLNRERAVISFNQRVLALAEDGRVPLLERLRFLAIVSSNLDEFFEIRVAGLKEQIKAGNTAAEPDGLPPQELCLQLSQATRALVKQQYAVLNEQLLPALAREGIVFLRRAAWNQTQKAWIADYFHQAVMPVLTPIGLDPAHPFPRMLNKSLNFVVELHGHDAFGRNSATAIVQAPRTLPRIIRLPEKMAECEHGFVFLSSILHQHIEELFAGMQVLDCHAFRVTRNSDLFVDDEEVKNLRTSLQGELPQRHFGDAVRLEVVGTCPAHLSEFLLQQFNLAEADLYRVPGLVNLARLYGVHELVNRPDLKYPPFQAGLPKILSKRADLFASMRQQDVLLHLPFQAFSPLIQLLEQAASDPQVVVIRMTVYRTGIDSVLMDLLLRAAREGKEVTVVVELMARFDEEANLSIASRLEAVGAHVVYGVFGYKTHAKMLQILRREETGYRSYCHLGTGNYHPRTARYYTDFGLFTCHDGICADVAEVFKQLTGLGKARPLQFLWQAPFSLHAQVLQAIAAETAAARAGHKARIIAKMNALVEAEIIHALYAASNAGVEIDLIVRGICTLRPGVAGLSENIRVHSILGRFLEHSRIYHFFAAGAENLYLASADWMERNCFRRIEIAVPILDPKLKKRILKEGIKPYLQDNVQAWEMDGDGQYQRRRDNPRSKRRAPHCAQEELLAALTLKV